MNSFKTVSGETVFELTERRSKFIATLKHIENEEEATEFLDKLRNKYWDAKHNVYAYVLNENNIKRYSDDGEPHGTAGKPVLDVIDGAELKNVIVVVTRYFGGILLGTGGLVRAYSASASGAINSANIKTMTDCREIEIECDYNQFDVLNNLLSSISGGVLNSEFSNKVISNIYISETEADSFLNNLTNTFGGKIVFKIKGNKFYPI